MDPHKSSREKEEPGRARGRLTHSDAVEQHDAKKEEGNNTQ